MYMLKEKLWLNADKTKAVPDGSIEAAFLLGIEGDEIPDAQAAELGLPGGGAATRRASSAERAANAGPTAAQRRRGEASEEPTPPENPANNADGEPEATNPETMSDEELDLALMEADIEVPDDATREDKIAALTAANSAAGEGEEGV